MSTCLPDGITSYSDTQTQHTPRGDPSWVNTKSGSLLLHSLSATSARHRNMFPDTRVSWPESHPVPGASSWLDLGVRSVYPT